MICDNCKWCKHLSCNEHEQFARWYPPLKSDIGLPDSLSRDDAYVRGMADGIEEVIKEVKYIYQGISYCNSDGCQCYLMLDLIRKHDPEYVF